MRIGQLARKYDIQIQEIISYLEDMEQIGDSLHSNTKLDEQTEILVAKRFDFVLEEVVEQEEEVLEQEEIEETVEAVEPEKQEEVREEPVEEKEEVPVELQIPAFKVSKESANDEFDLLLPESEYSPLPANEIEDPSPKIEVIEPIPEEKAPDLPEKEEFVIESDQLLEQLESEEPTIDLSKVTKIKASRKELDGLKVIGKIDLPEPKTRTEEKVDQEEAEAKPDRQSRHQRVQISEEEREKRRLRAKNKKEQYEEREAERRSEKERKNEKARKKAHYRQKLQPAKPIQRKQIVKAEIPKEPIITETVEQILQPKTTVFGKFWKWLNT